MYVKAGQHKCICNWHSMLMVATINLQIQLTMIKLSEKKIKRHRPHRSFRHKPQKWSCCLYYVGLCRMYYFWEDDHFCLIISHINIIYLFSIHLSSELCSLLLTRISHTSCHWCPVSSMLPNFVYLLIFYSILFFFSPKPGRLHEGNWAQQSVKIES